MKINSMKHITKRGIVKRNPPQAVWRVKGQGDPVKEVWEDVHGNLWFITELGERECFGYARLYHMPQFAEWGYIPTLQDIEDQIGKDMVWKVHKNNWSNINTYEKGLLIKDLPPGIKSSIRVFDTSSLEGLKKAEAYQRKLYEKYDEVIVQPVGFNKVRISGIR